jgi:bis(5'-nucleosyl)-tetraphosphatase (symmetrical)
MATYAIGDIQGCYHSFRQLLERIDFHPSRDRLWLVGDLINRGSGSLEVLRWVCQHQSVVTLVLGNHDLHALAVAEGFVPEHRHDTLQSIFAAPDRVEMLDWLRRQPLLHVEDGYLMVHAGLLPQWDVEQALALAGEVQAALRGEAYRDFLAHMYGNQPGRWSEELQGMDRLRLITNAMTRLRACRPDGSMDFDFKGELADMPEGLLPWFEMPGRRSSDTDIIFGHWSALGLQQRPHLFALDSGCLWGGQLTALRLQDRQIFQVDCDPRDAPRPLQ